MALLPSVRQANAVSGNAQLAYFGAIVAALHYRPDYVGQDGGGVPFLPYAHRIIRREIVKQLRQTWRAENQAVPISELEERRRQTGVTEADPLEPIQHREPAPGRAAEAREAVALIRRHLDARSFDLLVKTYVEGYSRREVGRQCGLSGVRVHQLVEAAKEKARRMLGD